MSEFFDHIPENLQRFIAAQKMFFIATAAASGRISLSPKGMDSFRCLSARQAAYLDLMGSGNETAAYLKNDGRATIMFCSFGPAPLILRLYAKGRTVQRDTDEWCELAGKFPVMPGARQIMLFNIESVQTSCGYAVPEYELKNERQTLLKYTQDKTEADLNTYFQKKNAVSIDGFETGIKIT